MTVLVTGAAGFIGYHVAEALLGRGEPVLGVDDLNDYYDVRLKQARLARLQRQPAFSFVKLDIAEAERLAGLVAAAQDVDRIVHLAAQAGVRHSLEQPFAYIRSNVAGHLAVLETARRMPGLRHLVYASSSSVYGASRVLPFREDDRADTPLSLYAATKRSG
jgi:UDP-glucuronate 4-epimerase